MSEANPPMERRTFIKLLGAAASATAAKTAVAIPAKRIAIITDQKDPLTSSGPAIWARGKLEEALSTKGISLQTELPADYAIVIASPESNSPFPLQYYFELRSSTAAWFHPAFNSPLSNQPYYAVSA
jgi:hypothetical protein